MTPAARALGGLTPPQKDAQRVLATVFGDDHLALSSDVAIEAGVASFVIAESARTHPEEIVELRAERGQYGHQRPRACELHLHACMVYGRMDACMCACMCACAHVRMCACAHVRMCACTRMHA